MKINLLRTRVRRRERREAEHPLEPIELLPYQTEPIEPLEVPATRAVSNEEYLAEMRWQVEEVVRGRDVETPPRSTNFGFSGYRGVAGVEGSSGWSGIGFSGYMGTTPYETAEKCYINPKIGSPQEIEHLPRLRILELLIKAVGDDRIPIAVLVDWEKSVGFKLSDEVKEVLFTYVDPNYKPPEKKAGRMIRVE